MLCPTPLPCLRLCSPTRSCRVGTLAEAPALGGGWEVLRPHCCLVLRAGPPGLTCPGSTDTGHLPQETQQLDGGKPVNSGLLLGPWDSCCWGCHVFWTLGSRTGALTQNPKGWDEVVALGWLTVSVPGRGELGLAMIPWRAMFWEALEFPRHVWGGT